MPQLLPSCRFWCTKLSLKQACSCLMPYTCWQTEGFLPATLPSFSQFQDVWPLLISFHVLPLFGIYKQVPLDCLPLAICKSQRKPSGAKYARWESYVWEGKELYHTTDFLVNCCIYSYEIIKKKSKVIALSLWKNLQKEIESKGLRKNRRQTYSTYRGG